jgi:hypothetical protein
VSTKVYTAYRVQKGVDPFTLLWDLKQRGQLEAKKRLKLIFDDILNGKAEEAARRIHQQNVEFREWAEANDHEITKANLFPLFNTWVEEHCAPELKKKNGAVMAVTHQKILTDIGREEDAKGNGVKAGAFDIDRWIHLNYGQQLTNLQRNPWALDVTITLRRYRTRYYIIPYCDTACAVTGSLDFLATDERLEEFGYWDNSDKPDEVTDHEWAWRSTVWNDLTKPELWGQFVAVDVVSWTGYDAVSPALEIAQELARPETQDVPE